MTKNLTKIAISLRIIYEDRYFEKRDGLSQEWPQFFSKLGAIPIYIPNKPDEVIKLLDEIGINGIIISGGEDIGTNIERDETEIKLIEYGINHNLPIFGVCRGMQMINHFFGGSIIKNASKLHSNQPHQIKLCKTISNNIDTIISVNSFHNNQIFDKNLGENLEIFAKTLFDNSIEGFFHKSHKIIGVMWHPEREQNETNLLILKKIFYEQNFWNELL